MPSIRPDRARTVAGCSFAALTLLAAGLPVSTAHAGLSGVSAVLADGVLQVTGGDRADAITLRVRPSDPTVIEVLTGLTRAPEFVFRRAATERITVESAGGDDRLTVDDRFGVLGEALPITIASGDGDDTVTAGGGDQVVLTGAGDDLVDPGAGDDHLLLGSGDDRVLWTTAYDGDVVEGQTGADQIVADGGSSADHLELNAVGARTRLSRPGQPGTVETASVEDWSVRPGGGADTVVVNDLTGAPLAALAIDLDSEGGGSSDGAADSVTVAGTAGADDVRVGHDGDALEITGTPQRVRVSGADHFVDRLVVDADLGSDTLRATPVVGDLLPVRLEGGPGQDVVVVEGTPVKDDMSVGTEDGRVRVNQSGDVVTSSAEQTRVDGLGGDDLLRVVDPVADLTDLVLDGGAGTDSLSGSADREVLLGGDGNDQLVGDGGDDVLLGGAGDDSVFWFDGDGADILEGGGGTDALQVVGDGGADLIDVTPIGGRVRVLRADEVQDLGGIERLSLFPLRGADTITVRDLSGTGLHEVTADLGGTVGGAGDGEPDQVTVTGTSGADTIALVGDPDFLVAQGLPWSPRVRHTDGLLDRLAVDTGLGLDSVTTTGLQPGTITVSVS